MQIKTSVRFSKVDKNAQHEMGKLFIGNHDIVWSEEVDSQIPFEGQKHKFQLPEAPYLRHSPPSTSINYTIQSQSGKNI